ncbi:hypothetical protein [Macrococcoides caseolyticum]|uniref:hypothetical protein n=1 Tax=Macrococcoides caseolyticum TaxID=69966 RepID=UPI000C325472|nr:hypothetical protein [Macrococcus caseolyticus]PKE22529.1 hypothetical protein CW688_02300 [Macrococcus caseolyticus]
MDINTLKTKNNFHNYITIKQADNTSPIELLLCGSEGSQLTNLNTTCTVTLLDTVDKQIRQKSTETIIGGLLAFKVKNALKANNHNLEVTLSDGSKYPSDGDFTILVSKSHTDRELEIINTMTYDDAVKKLAESVVTDFVAEKFNNLSSEGQSNAEVIVARNGKASLNDRLNKIEEKLTVSANDFGANPSASWTTNRDAFQAANDAVAAAGGGKVTVDEGTYLVKGLILSDNVIFDMYGVTFENPDGLAPSIIKSKKTKISGSISNGSNVLNVTDPMPIAKGDKIIIYNAGKIHTTQNTGLAGDIDAVTTIINLVGNDSKFPAKGYFRVDNELIGYSSISGTQLVGVERGALGTTAASHTSGTKIGTALHMYAEVTGISGTQVTLSRTAIGTAINTDVYVGTSNLSVLGLKFKGNKVAGGAPAAVYALELETTRKGTFNDLSFDKCDIGGIIFTKGSSDNVANNLKFTDCGIVDVASPRGANLWMFQGCERNRVSNITIDGETYNGVYIDDRTTISDPHDAPNDDNIVTGFSMDAKRLAPNVYPVGFCVVGGKRNKLIGGYVRGGMTGVQIDVGTQKYSIDNAVEPTHSNIIMGIHFDCPMGWNIATSGNTLHDCTLSENSTSTPVAATGNLIYGVSVARGEAFSDLFQTLSYDPVTRHMKVGTSPTSKVSFFGAPATLQGYSVKQVSGSGTIGDVAYGVNQLIDRLERLGLIAKNV